MSHTTHSARITGPVTYLSSGGESLNIPLGPCLVEDADGDAVDIVWGPVGERSALLPAEALAAAEKNGNILLLD